MQGRLKILILAIVVVATMAPAAAQTNSKAGQITLVAIMPEALKMSFNAGDAAHFAAAINTAESPVVATTVSTAWWLAPGRAKVVTSAYIKHPATPVLIALDTRLTASPLADSSFIDAHPYEFRLPQPVASTSISQIDSMTIMDDKRVSSSTTNLCTPNDPTANLPSDTSLRTLAIQVQPVL
jgi:hypothetical protein